MICSARGNAGAYGDTEYILLGPCHRCVKNKIKCSRVLPCLHCAKTNSAEDICQPSIHERASRSKVLAKHIQLGTFVHNDYAKYQLYLQTVHYGIRGKFARRSEVAEMWTRMKQTDVTGTDEKFSFENLPDPIKMLISGRDHFKIEWMKKGKYFIKSSDTYFKNFLWEDSVVEIAKKANVAPKLVDQTNMREYDMPYRLWVESIINPSVTIKYTGMAYWATDRLITNTTLRVVTVFLGPDEMITATVATRGYKTII